MEATILAAGSDSVGETFNIGGGSRISVNELVGMMENIIGNKAHVKYIEKQRGDVKDTLADVSKASEILHWAPEIDISGGLKTFVEWFKSEVRDKS